MKTRKHTDVSGVNKQNNSKNQSSSKRNNGASLKQKVDGKVVEGRSYEAKEWKQLTKNQKNVVKELCCKKHQGGKSHSATKGVKSVKFRDDIESVLNDALIAGIDVVKKKEKRDSANSDSEEDRTRSNFNRSRRTKTLTSDFGKFLKEMLIR